MAETSETGNGERVSEPRSGTIRSCIAVVIFVAILAAAFLIFLSREPQPVNTAEPAPSDPLPGPPIPPPPLTRLELIDAAVRATDAFATGRPSPPENAELVGRRFSLVMPFGCAGPSPEGDEADIFWSYDTEAGTLRASVTPEDWTESETLRALTGDMEFEAAEGFWISRPWIRSAACPAVSSAAEEREEDVTAPPVPAEEGSDEGPEEAAEGGEAAETDPGEAEGATIGETLGIVQFFEPGSRRAARRNGRPYQLTERLTEGGLDLSRGLRLVVEGRIAAFPNGQPVACRSNGADLPPTCLINIQTARVAITDASGERVFAEWTY